MARLMCMVCLDNKVQKTENSFYFCCLFELNKDEYLGPYQANLVLIAYASSEGSSKPAHPRSLAEPPLLAHTSSESRGTFKQKARSLALLNGWACAVKICHDGNLKNTNSLDALLFIIFREMKNISTSSTNLT